MHESPADENRRPIKSRQWPLFRKMAASLANSGVTPNAISVSSVVFGILAGLAFASTRHAAESSLQRVLWIAAAVLIQLRLISNLLDGMVAIEGGKKSAVGDLYNEVPDRLSDPAILIGAGYAAGGDAVLGMLAAIVALFVAYVRAIGAGVGAGQQFHGPMAKPQRMAVMTVCALYCGFAPTAWQPLWHGSWGIAAAALWLIIVGGVITACRRLFAIARIMRERAGEQP